MFLLLAGMFHETFLQAKETIIQIYTTGSDRCKFKINKIFGYMVSYYHLCSYFLE